MWLELFKAGKQTDSKGSAHDWTVEELDQIVANHAEARPITIDHPENGPIAKTAAWGWINGLKREGGSLYGQMADLVPEFALMLKNKMFKNRSIGLFRGPKGIFMDHLAFLGAKAPAVKGLEDIAFSTSNVSTFESEVGDIDTTNLIKGDDNMDAKELQAKLDEANAKIKEFEGNEAKLVEYTAKIEKLEADAAEAKNAGADKDSEVATLKSELKFEKEQREELKKSVDAIQASAKDLEFSTFCKEMVGEGKLKASEIDATTELMRGLDGQEAIDFAAAEGKIEKKTRLAIFQDSIRARDAVVNFEEVARKDEAIANEADANAKLEAEMHKLANSQNKNFNEHYSELQLAVFAANPALAKAVRGA